MAQIKNTAFEVRVSNGPFNMLENTVRTWMRMDNSGKTGWLLSAVCCWTEIQTRRTPTIFSIKSLKITGRSQKAFPWSDSIKTEIRFF